MGIKYEFYFLNSWQKLIVLALVLFIIQTIRVLFLQPATNNILIIILICLLFLIFGFNSCIKNKKIIITKDGLNTENSFWGFNNNFYNWSDIVVQDNEKYFIIRESFNKKIYVIPFFWGNKDNHNILDIVLNYKYHNYNID
ncbi:hypothetical protein MOMA_02180 [Moraxella macacae 0408225]|uniref:YcxB-like protein domain-containing protein n=1 Tax=Moraxella macacae 0408225 TaxID=1230338 RepID=L2F814_9GAMM|nr:hypothetical protein [Moraxella macacae]ELA09177.1 hypothetical protein MOMA_02180 [Moraxella macacae 0408225]